MCIDMQILTCMAVLFCVYLGGSVPYTVQFFYEQLITVAGQGVTTTVLLSRLAALGQENCTWLTRYVGYYYWGDYTSTNVAAGLLFGWWTSYGWHGRDPVGWWAGQWSWKMGWRGWLL